MIKKYILKNIKSNIMRRQGPINPALVKKVPTVIKTPIDEGQRFKYDAAKKAIFMRKPRNETQLLQEAASKFARGVEAAKLKSGLDKVRKVAIKQFAGTQFYTKRPGIVIRKDLTPKPGKNILSNDIRNFNVKKTRLSTSGDPFVFAKKTAVGKRTIARIDKAKTQAIKTARAAGLRALKKRSEELNVGIKKFGSQKSKFVQKYTEAESRELGFPPSEVFKSGRKKPMTAIDKSVSEYTTVEKFNPKTRKFETFRKFASGGSGKAGTGYIDRRKVFYDKKLKGYRKKR
jgi:hypothetical protein